ncbi:protein rep [Helicobacter suis]|uniref:protein rep n=1 Tax=Helicobacter suis TaxID=104628 RepID=UPI0013CFDEC6|nr:protein rep [Helicobacter suis]
MPILPHEFLSPFLTHKAEAMKLNLSQRYLDANNESKAYRCECCGDYLVFDTYQHLVTGETKRKLVGANFCAVRWCPMCCWLKAKKLITALYPVFQAVETNYNARYIFTTLTIKNALLEDLNATCKHLSKAWYRLFKRKAIERISLGFVRAIEFIGDQTPPAECHAHYHALIAVAPSYFTGRAYLKQATWTELWQKSLRVPYIPVVNVKAIKSKLCTELSANADVFNSKPLLKPLLECVKYSVKPAKIVKLSQAQFQTLDKQAKGIRQYNTGGLIKTLLKENANAEKDNAEVLSPDEWQFLQKEYFKWCGLEYKSDEVIPTEGLVIEYKFSTS